MRILWHSNHPAAATGYGMQSAQVLRKLQADGHEVVISAFYGQEGYIGEWEGMTVLPTDHTAFGRHALPLYAAHFAGELDVRDVQTILLMDVWALGGSYHLLNEMRVAAWAPVDHDPVPPRVRQFFDLTHATPIAMSHFGASRFVEIGLDPLYVPHGVDTDTFAPQTDRRVEYREAMKVPVDAFVVGMVANNQGRTPPRKAFPQVFHAFSIFRQTHPDAFLYLHSELAGTRQGLPLGELAEFYKIPKSAYGCTDQFFYSLGLSQEQMAVLYNGFDVLASPSYGEGFGVPIIEAQACGCPVIVSNWTSMPELCGAGWIVEGEPWYDPHHGAAYLCPSIGSIVEALEAAYEARSDLELKATARAFATQYDERLVYDRYWRPVLDKLDAPREVGPIMLPTKVREEVAA